MTENASAVPKYILVVDDEPDVLRYQAAILEDAGFEVATASSGAEALRIVEKRAPDLVSLDLVMPEKGGIRFLFALRKRREWATIPVIIVTGHAHDAVGRSHLADLRSGDAISGPQVCLDKPVRPETYVAAVMERLGLAEAAGPSGRAPRSLRERIDARLAGADDDTLRAVLRLLEAAPGGAGPADGEAAAGPRILVVDDEPDAAAYIAAILEDEGYAVTKETKPAGAVAAARVHRPALITLDVDMPGKSGVEVYAELAADPDLRGIPVVVVTGVAGDVESRFAALPGAPAIRAFLKKPLEPAALLRTAETVIRGQA